MKLPSRIGRAVSLYASAVGKAILAYLPREDRDRLLAHVTFERHTDTTITDRDSFEAELAQVREQGWSVDNGEHDAYVMCVAAPVRDSRGKVVAAVSVTAIEVIETLDQLKEKLPLVLETAALISEEAGYTPEPPSAS